MQATSIIQARHPSRLDQPSRLGQQCRRGQFSDNTLLIITVFVCKIKNLEGSLKERSTRFLASGFFINQLHMDPPKKFELCFEIPEIFELKSCSLG
jgi:hypothetical protein